MKACWLGRVIAESNGTVKLAGYSYFPRADVRMEYLRPGIELVSHGSSATMALRHPAGTAAMNDKRTIEHYHEHELVCEAAPATHGWYYTISVVSHYGDRSEVQTERSPSSYSSDLEALHAARQRGRVLIDELIAGSKSA